jgi:hypothetical protein
MNVIVNLLAERIRQARKPAHLHSHVEILALDVAGRDVLFSRVADDFDAFGAQTLRGAVASLPFRIVAVNLVSWRSRSGYQTHQGTAVKYIRWPSVVNWIRFAKRPATS